MMSSPSQPQSTFTLSCILGGFQDPPLSSFQSLCCQTRSLTDLLTAVAALFVRRQPHNAPFLHSARTVQRVVTEECILEFVHFELGTPTPAAWIQVFEKRLSLRCQQFQQHGPQSMRSLLARGSLLCIGECGSEHCRTSTSQIRHSLWSPGPVALGALRGSSRARSGFVSRLREHAWCKCCGGSICFFWRVPPHTFTDLKMCSSAQLEDT